MHKAASAGAIVLAAAMGCQTGPKTEAREGEPSESMAKDQPDGELHVEVFYRERMMLPPGATLTVTLEDGAKMDVAAEKIAEETLDLEGGPPYHVTLRYDRAVLNPPGRYAVRARIDHDGRLMFTSMEHNPAFGVHGSKDEPVHDPVEVLVKRIPASTRATPLTGTQWVLTSLRGEPAGAGAGGESPHITLSEKEQRVFGFAGCNRITGGYELDGADLSFSKMAMTMKACPEGMDLEREVAQALEATKSHEISDGVLRLKNEDGTVVSEWKAD